MSNSGPGADSLPKQKKKYILSRLEGGSGGGNVKYERVRHFGNVNKITVKYKGETRVYQRLYKVKTRNQGLCGETHPVTGVPFGNKRFYVGDKLCEGVFPEWDCLCTVSIDDNTWEKKNRNPHREKAKDIITEQCRNNPDFKKNILDKADEMCARYKNEIDEKEFRQEVEDLVNGKLTKSNCFEFEHLVSENSSDHYIGVVPKCLHRYTAHTGNHSINVNNKGDISCTNTFVLVSKT